MEIKNYENYLIYEDGSVYNKKHVRYLKPSISKNGYKKITLSKNNKQKNFLVHRLLAEAYIPNPDNKPLVDHINRKKDDNRIENLRWCTASENLRNCDLRKNNTSGYTGIYKVFRTSCKQGFRWEFTAKVNGKYKCIKSSINFEKLKEFAIKWKKDNEYDF